MLRRKKQNGEQNKNNRKMQVIRISKTFDTVIAGKTGIRKSKSVGIISIYINKLHQGRSFHTLCNVDKLLLFYYRLIDNLTINVNVNETM